ncbi:MAG: DUF6067 family protein, partial [Armatimonadota bacterium]|nr:DUF6067 family protein [Armatimonadota bacterium]
MCVFLRCLGLAGLLLCLAAVAFGANAVENTNIPTVNPVAVVPFLAAPPKLDGVIAPGEWNTLHVGRFVSQNNDLLERHAGEFWVGCDRHKLYVAVRSAVHPTQGAIAKFVPRGNADQDVVFDDAIEIWVDNSPGSETGQYFQIIVNPNGAIYDARFTHRDKIAQKSWRASMEQAHTVKDGVWTAELAIDLSSLAITDPTQPLAMRVCRDYKNPWDQARWEPRVHSFDATETMARVRFTDAAPVVEELPVQDAQGVTVGLALSNPTAQPLPLHVKLGYNAQDQPRYFQNSDITLAPGQSQTVVYKKPFFTPDDYPALGESLVTDAAGNTLYHRDFKWRTHPSDPLWDNLTAASPQEAVHFDIGWYPSYHRLRWRANMAALAGKESIRQMRLVVRANGSETLLCEQPLAVGKDFAALGDITLPALPAGQYEAVLYLDAAQPAAKPVRVAPFTISAHFVWQDNRLGMDDILVPPFTALTVQGRTVHAILRTHTLNDDGLWSQVQSLGQDLLAGPMRLEVRRGGKLQSVTGKLRFQSAKPTTVVAVSDWKAGALQGRTTGEFDYDGCMKVTLDLPPSKTPIDSLDLVVPLKDSLFTLMHACGEGLRSNYGGFVPKGEGIVWTSADASRDQLLGTFLPYLFVGGPERGLVWFASNDRDWVVDTSDKAAPALTLERHGGILTLRVRLIQKKAVWDKPRHIVFGLQATPVKPMPS